MQTENSPYLQDEYNVKKIRERLPDDFYCDPYYSNTIFDSFKNILSQTGRFFLGISDASLRALRSFNTELLYMSLRYEGYSDDYIKTFFETNADFHDRMVMNEETYKSRTYRRKADFHQSMADRYRTAVDTINSRSEETPASPPPPPVDYDLLAKKVAEELRKNAL